MLEAVLAGEAARLTDYQGGAQAVMAADTLIAALVKDGSISRAEAEALRPGLDRAYLAARDANRWEAGALKRALGDVAMQVRALR
jgi:hypothetical protein